FTELVCPLRKACWQDGVELATRSRIGDTSCVIASAGGCAMSAYNDRADFGISEPEDILAPHHYAAVRSGGRLMRALPLWCYTSERFFAAEKEHIFLPSWNLMEREEIVPDAGDFQTLTYFGVQLLVVRGKDMKIRVFANTCRHRGAQVAQGSGNCKAFR